MTKSRHLFLNVYCLHQSTYLTYQSQTLARWKAARWHCAKQASEQKFRSPISLLPHHPQFRNLSTFLKCDTNYYNLNDFV